MHKCEDKTSKMTLKHNQHKTLKLREVIAQSTTPNSLLFRTHSTNFLFEFYFVAEVGGEDSLLFYMKASSTYISLKIQK